MIKSEGFKITVNEHEKCMKLCSIAGKELKYPYTVSKLMSSNGKLSLDFEEEVSEEERELEKYLNDLRAEYKENEILEYVIFTVKRKYGDSITMYFIKYNEQTDSYNMLMMFHKNTTRPNNVNHMPEVCRGFNVHPNFK